MAHSQPIVITGAREPLALDRLAADVVVIDADRIARSTADSLADLLRRETGAQLSRNGGPGHASGLFIRGANNQQSVLLVDGVRVGSATLGQPSWDALALRDIDRIEVLRGPGSSLYGSDAVGGVVQVFTKRGAPGWRGGVGVGGGNHGGAQAAGNFSGAIGDWDLAAALSHERSDGVSTLRPGDRFGNANPDNDGYRQDSAQARLGWRLAPGQRLGAMVLQTRLRSQYDASEYLPPAFAQDASPDFRSRLKTQVAALDWRGTLTAGLTGSAQASRSIDDSADGAKVVDRFRTRRQAAGAQVAWQTGVLGQLVVAYDWRDERAESSSDIDSVERRTHAGVLSLTGQASGWSWQADARRDDASDYGGITTWRLGGGYLLLPGLRLRALYGTTYRAPSFNDLYFPGYGIPTLAPERGRSVEAGIVWQRGDTKAEATVYRNRVRELIEYEGDRSFCPPDPAYDFGCPRNVGRARLTGATIAGSQRLAAFTLRGSVDLLDAKDRDTGQRLNRRAAHQETLGLDWSAGVWTAGANVLRVGARPDAGQALASETTLDLIGSWRFAPGWSLQGKVINATDRHTEPARDYQGVGRQWWLGVRLALGS